MSFDEGPLRPRLDSWKEIALRLGRSVRTVQRWEKEEGLPVHRLTHQHRGSIFAFRDEVDAWWESKSVRLLLPASEQIEAIPSASSSERPRSPWRIPVWIAAGALASLLVGWFVVNTRGGHEPDKAPDPPFPLTSFPESESYPSFAPDGKSFSFSWNSVPGNVDIFIKSVNSSEVRRLTTDPHVDYQSAWSPDGRHIAFVRNLARETGELMLTPAEGGLERSLGVFQGLSTNNLKVPPPHIGWTPDSNYLIVSGQDEADGPLQLHRVDVKNGMRVPILEAEPRILGDAGPAVSPDGKRLAFHRFKAMGSGEIRVAQLSADYLALGTESVVSDGKFNANPVWINNNELVFYGYRQGDFQMLRVWANSRSPANPVLGGTPGKHISYSAAAARLAFMQDKVEDDIWRLTLRAPGEAEGPARELIRSSHQDVVPEYSPSGDSIAFTSNRAGYPNVWICDRDGNHSRQVSHLDGSITGPIAWSPDGKRLVFASNATGAGDIYTIAAKEGFEAPRNLTSDAADDIRPSWSRDGKWIYFGSNRSGRYEVWKVAAEGGKPIQVTLAGGSSPVESYDGDWLYYTSNNHYDTSLWRKPTRGGVAELVVKQLNYWYSVGRSGIYFGGMNQGELRYWNAAKREERLLFQMKQYMALGLGVSPDERDLLVSVAQRTGGDIMTISPYR